MESFQLMQTFQSPFSRMMPGPPVVVCKGDHVVVDVKNHLAAEVTSFHFHGIEFSINLMIKVGVYLILKKDKN